MDSDFAIEKIGTLYAEVFDRVHDTGAFKDFTATVQGKSPLAEIHRRLEVLSLEIATILIDHIDQNSYFELSGSSLSHEKKFAIDVYDIANSEESSIAKMKIAEDFEVGDSEDTQDHLRVYSSNISLDGIALCGIALGAGLQIECKELSLPLIEGDERTDISTNTTLFGQLGFASVSAVEKWLRHLSEPKFHNMSTFLIYSSANKERLQVKYVSEKNYFAILQASAEESVLSKFNSIDTAKTAIYNWFNKR